jgi:hypothetical protein
MPQMWASRDGAKGETWGTSMRTGLLARTGRFPLENLTLRTPSIRGKNPGPSGSRAVGCDVGFLHLLLRRRA